MKNYKPTPMGMVVSQFDVYVTDEKNFKPYVSPLATSKVSSKSKSSSKTTTEDDGFVLHQGAIKNTISFRNHKNANWGFDYEGMSGEGSLEIPYNSYYLQYLYKGVRCLLKVNRNEYGSQKPPRTHSFLCFITDVKINQDNFISLTLSHFTKLLDQNAELSFKGLLRSQILKEVIKSAGMIPKVDFSGLTDEKIDYTSISSSGSSNDSSTSDGSMSWDDLWKYAHKWSYRGWGSNHDPKKAWDTMRGGSKGNKGLNYGDCYDATAFLYYAINFKVEGNYKARDCVGKGNGSSGTHHAVQVKKDGGEWQFPSEYDGMTTNLHVGSLKKSFKVCRDPPDANGNIPSYSNKWYGNRG